MNEERDEPAAPVIAIDGPTASGKGTIAQRVAQALGWHYLDSGALYRIVALLALRSETPLDDADALAALARGLAPRFEHGRILVDGEDVADAIRAEQVGSAASRIAVHADLRQALVDLQRGFRRRPGRRRSRHGHRDLSGRAAQGIPDRQRGVARQKAS